MAVSGFFARLKSGLSRSASKLTENITATFTKRKLDDEALEELEEQLIAADLGVVVAERIIRGFRSTRFGKEVTSEEIRETLGTEIGKILTLDVPELDKRNILYETAAGIFHE